MYADIHPIMQRLVSELGLTQEVFPEGWANKERFYLKGQHYRQEDIESNSVTLPYDLTPEEKQNQGNIVKFYFKKLTGLDLQPLMPREQRLLLKVIKTNKRLYEHRIDEALDLVASPGGKEFFKAIVKSRYAIYKDASALLVFGDEMDYNNANTTLYKVREGMDSIPKKLIEKFTMASSSNKVTFNRKLEAIQRFQNMTYILKLKETKTVDGRIIELGPEEFLCAKQVILAIPKDSLDHLQWSGTKGWTQRMALNAVRPVPEHRVVMSFNVDFWSGTDFPKMTNIKFTDTVLGSLQALGKSNNQNLLLATLNSGEEVRQLERLNLGSPTQGSLNGTLQVSEDLKSAIVDKLFEIFKLQSRSLINPISSVARFWTVPPHVGGVTVWRAGFHFEDARQSLQHPSLIDKVYIVTPDIAFGNRQEWTEGGLEDVDRIMQKYIL
ncbi:aplysianin-A-like isoform X3 [Physella acuta]|nr:aplysianin-A-like isoform X2 [Physella acuta]XP_059142349.1 aplysianin-A-like isoform X3 [Physella acuta]